ERAGSRSDSRRGGAEHRPQHRRAGHVGRDATGSARHERRHPSRTKNRKLTTETQRHREENKEKKKRYKEIQFALISIISLCLCAYVVNLFLSNRRCGCCERTDRLSYRVLAG